MQPGADARFDAARDKVDLTGMTPSGKFNAIAGPFRDEIRDCLSKIPAEITRTLDGAKNKKVEKIRKFVLQEYKDLRESLMLIAESKLRGLSIRLGFSEMPGFDLIQDSDKVETETNLAVDKLKRSVWSRLDIPVKVIYGVLGIL